MSHPFDATLKDVLAQDPKDFESVSAFGLPKIAPARALNVDLSTISAATDVAFGFGEPLQEIVDLNFQSGPDTSLADRLLLYHAAYRLRYGVPVRSVAILLRPKADSPNLTGKLSYVAGGKRLEFEYDVVRLWREPVEPFLKGGVGLLPLATLCQAPAGLSLQEGLRQIVREIDRRLAQETDHGHAVRLMTAAFILTGMRVPKEAVASIYEGVRIMHESTAWDVIMDEGRAEGRMEGEINFLLRQGTRKFGVPDAQSEASLKGIHDLDRLERLADAILTAQSWQELLSTQ
jgi:hypothetical protein